MVWEVNLGYDLEVKVNKYLKNKSIITFVDVNGKWHDFTNPEPKPEGHYDDIVDALYDENSVQLLARSDRTARDARSAT